MTLFTLAEDERMVSVTRLADVGNGDDGSEEDDDTDTDTDTDEVSES